MSEDEEEQKRLDDERQRKDAAEEAAAEKEQMWLELKGEQVYVDYSSGKGNYTGQRFAQRPESKVAKRWLAAGHSFNKIADWLHVEPRTIEAFYYYQENDIAIIRQKMLHSLVPLFMDAAEKTHELVPHLKTADKGAIVTGIIGDKIMQLAGLPTAKIEINHHFDVGAELRKLNEEAREAFKKAKARVIEPLELEDGQTT